VNLGHIIEALNERQQVSPAQEIRDEVRDSAGDDSQVSEPADRKGLKQDSWKAFARIGLQVAQALRHAHRKGVLHNDVKPGNLLIDASGKVFVTDFGLAEPLNPESSEVDESVNGTLRYMAPERFAGVCDETSDVYSLGITLFELVTQQSAFDTDSQVGLITAIAAGDVRSVSETGNDLPPDLAAVIGKAISREPNDRYQSAGEFASDLLRFINGERVSAKSAGGIFRWLRRSGR
jgi:eukaryotic-like serine/threonine-protein kinase